MANFDVDTECKRYMWQGVTLLEFIDEKRLLLEMGKLESKLKVEEKQCAAFENPIFDYHIPEPPKNVRMPDKVSFVFFYLL
ncbi:hypothetical protein ACLOJK_005991 [Asimina triloba]